MIDSLIGVCSATALTLLLSSARGLCREGSTDPSDQARSVTLALYGCVVAVVTLGLFIAVT
ncbi:hypothetical protein HRW23_20790 [Streptomyces lunaelactis]|uniref:hypothetical protein n=1 Tax=Streptomyces lunaelactis TaxID=1535768 RepID=UPI001584A885|nr:hypothetical protein [Streptomyces lunaelactis]NUK04784.1 hypothetical protein [Streptomyces lunaelactis]NUK20128.1 hypothetical protein [Streptomyces lunaelactis]NUK72639.1 hypothetical protein [Streptomyces lunaelactis]NUK79792.1 hypothetical protein [Streptomyces lunaelactis]